MGICLSNELGHHHGDLVHNNSPELAGRRSGNDEYVIIGDHPNAAWFAWNGLNHSGQERATTMTYEHLSRTEHLTSPALRVIYSRLRQCLLHRPSDLNLRVAQHTSSVVWTCPQQSPLKSFLPGEIIMASWQPVINAEIDALGSGSAEGTGVLFATKLRLVWISFKAFENPDYHDFIAIGWYTIQNITNVPFTSGRQDEGKTDQILSISAQNNNACYRVTFVFTRAMRKSLRRINLYRSWAYVTAPFRDLLVKDPRLCVSVSDSADLNDFQPVQLEGEAFVALWPSVSSRMGNASDLEPGKVLLTDKRFVWLSSRRPRELNISLPLHLITDVEVLLLDIGIAVAITLQIRYAKKTVAFTPSHQTMSLILARAVLIEKTRLHAKHCPYLGLLWDDTYECKGVEGSSSLMSTGVAVQPRRGPVFSKYNDRKGTEQLAWIRPRSGSRMLIEDINAVFVDWRDTEFCSQLPGNSETCPYLASDCVICGSNRIECVFDPCRHICCCLSCGSSLLSCPICQGRIGEVMPILTQR